MSDPICFFNGEFLPAEKALISVADLGFIHGVTVAEQIRTFQHQPFLLAEHLCRFDRGLNLLGIELPARAEIEATIRTVVDHNAQHLDPGQELGICVFATPGESCRFQPTGKDAHLSDTNPSGTKRGATFGIHTYLILHPDIEKRYRELVTVGFALNQDVSSSCWPKNVKIRSRLHYFLADHQQKQLDGPAKNWIPVLTTFDPNSGKQFIREASTSTPIFIFNSNQITISPQSEILSSVSLDFVIAIAAELGMEVVRREICVDEITEMQSMFLVSTPFCIYDVKSIMDHRLQTDSNELSQIKSRWKQIIDCDFETRP